MAESPSLGVTFRPQSPPEELRAAAQAAQGLFLGAFLGGVPAGAAVLYDQRQYWLGRPVRCALVWTADASVLVLPPDILDRHAPGVGAVPPRPGPAWPDRSS